MIGINLSSAEFGKIGDKYGYGYIYPSAKDLAFYAKQGVELVRLPVRWERLQPTANGEIDTAELGRLTKFLKDADAAGVKVIVDVHNYGTYYGDKLGSDAVPASQFADFWKKLASAIGDLPAVAGYDLMNEPHGLADASIWPNAAQAAVNAIREVDTDHDIYVEGNNWGSALGWSKNNALLDIKDPADKIVYEAHLYFDKYSTGTYTGTYDSEGAWADMGQAKIADFVNWLDARGAKGFIGEFAVPDDDPRWLTVLDKFLTAMSDAGLDGTYWGAGPWWGDYKLGLRDKDGTASEQLTILAQHIASDADAAAAAETAANAPTTSTPKPADIPPGEAVWTGTAMHDVLHGTAGVDHFIFSAGNDTYDGEGGIDVLDLSAETRGSVIDLVAGTVSGGVGKAVIRNIETVIGGAGADRITGDANANTLIGGDGSDTLDGGAGADRLEGGLGNDTYVVDNVGDVVIEAADAGTDTIRTTLDNYVLPANFERLTLLGTAITGTGNTLDNLLTGDDAANILYGLGGVDTIKGGLGNDKLYGGDGNDKLYGEAGNDTLDGGVGNDLLDGGAGADRMVGGAGNDTYVVDDAGDVVVEAGSGGTDAVKSGLASYTLGANVENLTLTLATGATGRGNELANAITGGAGDDALYGEGGKDTLKGGAGNDKLFGGEGEDTLDGGTGVDVLTGGIGNDVYVVDDSRDQTVEKANEGTDQVRSTAATYTLGDNVENLLLNGTGDIAGTGNGLANSITGNAGANVLSGMGGADKIDGNAGDDRIDGGDGDDTLTGGTGTDVLTGGAGKDVFKFAKVEETTVAAPDKITDFVSGQDKIDLSAIDAKTAVSGNQAFSLISGAFTKQAGELRYELGHAADGHVFTLVQGDVNGDGVPDFALVLDNYAAGLKATDFAL